MVKKKSLKITGWAISVDWSDGKTTLVGDMPDDVSQAVDDWLTEYEGTICPNCKTEMNEPDLDDLEEGATPMWYCFKCKKNIRRYKEL